jgi:uncharacterized protein YecE (DUF72 family)
LNAVEINSTFYGSHRPQTYGKWAAAVPETFRFALKMPKEITHIRRLTDVTVPLEQFFGEIAGIGGRRGPLLIQLPPKLEFDPKKVEAFFRELKKSKAGEAVVEPRHESWFTPKANALFKKWEIPRVSAHPSPVSGGDQPGGWEGLVYYRLHGYPKKYYSAYEDHFLDEMAGQLLKWSKKAVVWCIFDNTAAGAAAVNALDLKAKLTRSPTAGKKRAQAAST